jgi:hypothetical protein
MASTIKVTNINTPDGTGNIIVDRPLSGSGASLTNLPAANLTGTLPAISGASLTNLPAANLTGTLPAISGASLTNLPAGGDKRNFIIDGDFTQWPEGNKTNETTNVYGPALWRLTHSTSTANMDMTKSTTVPTFAQSSHTSEFSFLVDVGSVADATPSTNDLKLLRYFVTGSDYTYLHSKEVTLAFWVKGSTIGQYGVAFKNSATDRGYITSFNLVAANTWEYKTITITLDTTGTWLFTEADIGLIIEFQFLSGANRLTSSPGSWQAENKFGSSGQVNMMALTTNNIAFSQVGLYIGSTAPTFLGEPISTVQTQVEYYVESFNYDLEGSAIVPLGSGVFVSATQLRAHVPFNTRKRVPATMTNSSTANQFSIQFGASGSDVSSINGWTQPSTVGAVFMVTHGPSVSGGEAGNLRCDNSGAWVLADARH